MSKLENCDFCQPEDFAWRIIREDDHVVSFLSDPRRAVGHSLVIPREHREPPELLTEEERIALLAETSRLSKLMLGAFAVGVDVWQKTRPSVAENAIKRNHFHTHVIPSKPGDEIYSTGIIWTPDKFDKLTNEEAEMVLEILRA
jgi:histidine triad (HIT) family protein